MSIEGEAGPTDVAGDRSRWRGRRLLILGIGVVLLLVLAGALSYLLVDEGPSDDSDLRTARVEVPAAENGYLIVKDLQVDLPFDEVSAWDAEGDSWDPRLGRRLLEKNAGALMALEEALRKPRFQLPAIDRFDQMDVTVAMHLRRLSNLMGIRLRVHRESGEIGEALEDALRILRFGRVLEGAGDTIVIFLVGDAIQETGLRLLETLRLLLSPSQAKECARVLVKLRPDREGLAESLRLEYRMVLPEVDAPAEGRSEDFPMPPLPRHPPLPPNATRPDETRGG